MRLLMIVFLSSFWLNGMCCAAEQPPDIVVILVDDMGYGDPACFNPGSRIRTPSINGLARDGMRFTDAHAPGPLCHMSRYGLMTGRYPFRTNVGRWARQPLINSDQTTLASMLRSRGYHTAMVGKWHLGFQEQGYDRDLPGGPVDVGFDSFFGIRASTDIPPYFYIRDRRAVQPPTKPIDANASPGWSPIQGAFWRKGLIAPDLELEDVLPDLTTEAIRVIQDQAKRNQSRDERQPLFLYLAYPAPHTPWLPSSEFAGKSDVGMYGDFTTMVDAMVGRVLEAIAATGRKRDTLIVFTSDNGPVWYEEDVKRLRHDSAGGLRGMKADAWEAGHRMPFIVRWPARIEAGTQSDELVSFVDLMATFAALTGYRLQTGEGPDSFDFSKVLLGTAKVGEHVRSHLVINSGAGLMSIRQGQWKLIDGLGSGGFSKPRRLKPGLDEPAQQLYDLGKDRAESANLASSMSGDRKSVV